MIIPCTNYRYCKTSLVLKPNIPNCPYTTAKLLAEGVNHFKWSLAGIDTYRCKKCTEERKKR